MLVLKLSRLLSPALILMLVISVPAAAPVMSATTNLPQCPGIPVYQVADGVNATWTTLFLTNLQTAIDLAAADYLNISHPYACQDMVWVAKGVYKPSTSDRSASFVLKEGVAVYGGFGGADNGMSDRNWVANRTILSGDLNGDDGPAFSNNADNSYHVVFSHGNHGGSVLDGFTIRGGNASGTGDNANGGGIYSYNGSPTFNHLIITGNYAKTDGGGLFDAVGTSVMTHITFSGNRANSNGGGICFSESLSELDNAVFYGNQADNGGAICTNVSAHPTLTNATFSGNMAAAHGSGIYSDDTSSLTIQNSILWDNQPDGANPKIVEEIYHMPAGPGSTITYSLVFGCNGIGQWNPLCGVDGTHNLADVDPRFVDPTQGDLHLHANSPAIDQGSNLFISGVSTDLDNNPRIVQAQVDLGAYEYQFINTPPVITNFSKNAVSGQGISFSSADFTTHFTDGDQDALASIRITALPDHGALRLEQTAVTLNQVILAADLGKLNYLCPVNWSGTALFGWNASDGTVEADQAATVSISVVIPVFLPLISQ